MGIGKRWRSRSFALVLTLYLIVLLATTGAGLAFTASVESVLAGRTADDLDHLLAIDSALTCLPLLLLEPSSRPSAPGSSPAAVRRVEATFGPCRVTADVRREREKFSPRAGEAVDSVRARLRELARRHGLPEENVVVWPLVTPPQAPRLRAFMWFDQVVKPMGLEDVFRWRLPAEESSPSRAKKTWSELLTFWSGRSGETLSVDLQTHIENDVRRWYVVVSVQNNRFGVLHWGPTP
jgi:hypothetical protein